MLRGPSVWVSEGKSVSPYLDPPGGVLDLQGQLVSLDTHKP